MGQMQQSALILIYKLDSNTVIKEDEGGNKDEIRMKGRNRYGIEVW